MRMQANEGVSLRIIACACESMRLHALDCMCMRSTLPVVEVHVCPVTLVWCPALILLRLCVVDVEVLHPGHEPGRAIRDVDSRLQPSRAARPWRRSRRCTSSRRRSTPRCATRTAPSRRNPSTSWRRRWAARPTSPRSCRSWAGSFCSCRHENACKCIHMHTNANECKRINMNADECIHE